jgi:hypothetical protein
MLFANPFILARTSKVRVSLAGGKIISLPPHKCNGGPTSGLNRAVALHSISPVARDTVYLHKAEVTKQHDYGGPLDRMFPKD